MCIVTSTDKYWSFKSNMIVNLSHRLSLINIIIFFLLFAMERRVKHCTENWFLFAILDLVL